MAAAAVGQQASADNRSEKDKMLAGELYMSFTPELVLDRQHAKALLREYNEYSQRLDATMAGRTQLLARLLGSMDATDPPFIEAPLFVDYGYNIHLGAGVYINSGCTILDTCRVEIGARTLLGPNVQLYAATHPVDGALRNGTRGPELGKPISIGADAWIGGAAVLCPGVRIGEHAVVGAGSVVTRDVEPYCVVAGNPARVIRRLPHCPTAAGPDGGGAGM